MEAQFDSQNREGKVRTAWRLLEHIRLVVTIDGKFAVFQQLLVFFLF